MCSGIEAVTVAWQPLGYQAKWFSEIEPYPCALLDAYYNVPNHGDMEQLLDGRPLADIDVLVGGTPCQSFSVAGLRGGIDDARGNLALVFCELARRLRPRWVVWENVPGVLSNESGRAFGSILGALHECGYGLAWRVLNAQYFGVPQRRRRVFVVGYLGDWRRAGAVLFEPESLQGNSSARPGPREDTAGTLTASAADRRGSGQNPETLVAPTLTASSLEKQANGDQPYVVPTLRNRVPWGDQAGDEGQLVLNTSERYEAPDVAAPLTAGSSPNSKAPGRHQEDDENLVFKPSHYTRDKDGAPADIVPPLTAEQDRGDNDPLVFQSRYARNGRGAPSKVAPTLNAESGRTGKGDSAPLIFDPTQITHPENRTRDLHNSPSLSTSAHPPTLAFANTAGETALGVGEEAPPITGRKGDPGNVVLKTGIRRLTPRECERLQGFPDDYTLVPFRGKPASDTQRYRALGNSMAVPVMAWIGRRMKFVDELE